MGLDQEVFGVPIALVREILDFQRITKLPQAPAHVVGMIDVRNETVPVVDLRLKLGLPALAPTPATRIVVLSIQIAGHPTALGLLVDCVFEVASLDGDALHPPPVVGGRWRAESIAGIGRRKDAFVVVFDMPKLLADDEPLLAQREAAQDAA